MVPQLDPPDLGTMPSAFVYHAKATLVENLTQLDLHHLLNRARCQLIMSIFYRISSTREMEQSIDRSMILIVPTIVLVYNFINFVYSIYLYNEINQSYT